MRVFFTHFVHPAGCLFSLRPKKDGILRDFSVKNENIPFFAVAFLRMSCYIIEEEGSGK